MKRILSLVLILAMAVCMFAACGEQPTNPTSAAVTVEDAKTYLYAMYKDDDGTVARRDFKMVAAVMIDGVSFPIEWTTDAPEFVTIGAAQNNMVTIDIVEEPAEQVTFKLIGTMKDEAGNTASVTITRIIEAKKVTGVEFAAAPVAGTAYKFAVQQNNLGQTIYFTGEMSGYYLATSANPFDAIDVFVEDVEGGQRIFFTSAEGVKTYIDVVPRGEDQPGKVNVVLTEAPTCVYTWDAERKTFVTNTVADNVWYLGCYSSYNTISASNVSYIEDVTKIGDSQFPAGLCTVNIVAAQVATPAVDTAYKFAVQQNNLGQTIYFTGEMSGYYLATSVNPAEGVNVYVEATEGGVRLYFMKGEVKTYIDVVPRGADQPGKVNVVLTEAPTCVYTWDADRKTYIATVEGNAWYLGCYSSYNTISASGFNYIEKLEVIGDSQFPAGPYTVEGFMDMQPEFKTEEPVDPTEPVTPADPAADSTLSIADALALGASKEHNVYTEGKYYVTGVITEITNATYGNMKIADAEGNVLTIYGTFNADGTLKYGEMEAQPAVGDTVTIYGIIGQYNGTPQLKNGWFVPQGTEPEVKDTLTVAEALAMGAAMEHNVYTEGKFYVTGVITDVYNTQYGNMRITDAEGNILTVYGTYDADGTNRYDAMATKPVAGDTVTVYGIIGQYNGTPQMKNGWIVAHTAVAPSEPSQPTEPTEPTEPEAPEVVGTATRVEEVVVGDKIALVNQAGDSAMGAQDGTKRVVATAMVEGNTASLTADVVIITLEAGAQEGTFALKVADGYLAYSGSGNTIATQETVDEAASWIITFTDGVVSIQNVAYAERFLQYNISAPRFVCYKGTQEAPVIYKVVE